MSNAQPSWIGYTLHGRYKIEALLGSGGMASVYRALDPNLHRMVAVKLIHPHLAQQPEFVQRFSNEAATVAKLHHPNIVPVYDFSKDRGMYYMVMAYLTGGSLKERLLKETDMRLPLTETVRIMITICEAIASAHQLGIIHRDLKPANVLFDAEGNPHLTDFGIARMVGDQQTVTVVGTPAYMSPEQIKGDPNLDQRCDIYSLGIMLYEMASGVPPFEGSLGTLIFKHMQAPVPDIRLVNSQVPDPLVYIIEKALAKNPQQRFQSATEMATALRHLSQRSASTAIGYANAASQIGMGASHQTAVDPIQPSAHSGKPQNSPSKRPLWTWLIAFLLIAVLGAGLRASITKEPPATEEGNSSTADDSSTSLPSSPTPSDRLSKIQRIRERGNLLLAGVKYDFKPFGFVDDNGQVVGFDVDLIQAMADQWGVDVEFVQVTSSDRIPKLEAGEVDLLAASMTHQKDRDETIDFSQTYFLDGQSLLVRKDSGIEGIEGLDGKTISAIAGSTSIDNMQAFADANDLTIEILPFQEYLPAIESLKAGTVDALTSDSVALLQIAQDNPELAVVDGLFTEEPYGIGLPSGDSYFNNLVNFTLQDLKANGTYDELYQKWFGAEAIPYEVELMPGEWAYTFADSPTDLDTPTESKIEMILSQGSFTAGVKFDFAPFGFIEDKQLVGFDVDLMKEFAKRWLGDENAVEFVQVTSSDRIPKLAAGELDIVAASMTHQQERDEEIDFSQTYFLDGQSLLVAEESGIKSLTDLHGKRVAAIQGSTSIDKMQAKADELGISIEMVPLLEYPSALEALKAGQVDALTSDSIALSQFSRENPRLAVVGGRFTSEPYGIGLPNYDDRFRELVNFTLQEMKIDGTYDRLYEKWFGNDKPYAVEIWPGESSYLNINMVPMLRIPAGDFIQGSNHGFPNEAPEQNVTLDEFYIDQYEVTNFLYAKCVMAKECTPPKIERAVSSVEYFSSPAFRTYPVIWVTWEDANNYCRFAGKRLPTEAEWEKAARGSEGFSYPWGNEEPTPEQANFIGSGHIDTMPVGSHPTGVSPKGVHDMAGNVREWVNDWYAHDYYQNAPSQNPPGASKGVTKVVRGGAWNDAAVDLRTTRRKDFLPESIDGGLGFRCASSTFPPQR